MKNIKVSLRLTVFIVAVLLSLPCLAFEPVEKYPDLIMHGESYSNVCKPDERKKIFDATSGVVAFDQDGAWRAISTILCSSNTKDNRAYIASLMPKSVTVHSSGTGDEDVVERLKPTDALADSIMAKGQAWDASIRVESKKIYLHYFRNEACVHEVILSSIGKRWQISEIGEACD